MCQTQTFDKTKSDAFSERFMTILNHGALSTMISIGHRSGLFDSMAGCPQATSAEIAAGAGLDERYVREWLGAMVTGGIVDYEATTRRYTLPAEHAAWLTRAAGPDCLGSLAQYVPLLGTVEDDVLQCFRTGGGVPYARFERFKEVMAEDSGQTVVAALEEFILPLLGMSEQLAAGIDVLDVGCGSGRALNKLAGLFPKSRFVGYDLLEEHVDAARAEAAALGLDNVRFEVRDCTDLADQDAYDLVTTFDAIHDQKSPASVLKGIHRALRPDGLYLMQEIRASSHLQENMDHELAPFLYTVSTMHCMTVSLAQGGDGLGTMWGRELALELLDDAGFPNVEIRSLEHDPQNEYYLCRTR